MRMLLALGLASLCLPGPALAKSREIAAILCYPRAEMLQLMQTQFGERRLGRGIQRPAQIVEVWASDRTGAWMFVTTDPDGLSCIVAQGEGWEGLALPAPDEEPS